MVGSYALRSCWPTWKFSLRKSGSAIMDELCLNRASGSGDDGVRRPLSIRDAE